MSSPVMTETLMLEKTLKTSKLERKVTSTNIQVHKFSTLESLMIIHLSCTTVQKPSPKMARTLLIDLTAVTLHFQIQSASLRLMSTNSTNCTTAMEQQRQQQQQHRLLQAVATRQSTRNTALPGPSNTAKASMPTSWQRTARSPAINVAVATQQRTRIAALTGPRNTAKAGMPTSWQRTARSPAISARLPTSQSTIVSEGFKGGTRGAPIIPRDVSLSDSKCWNGGQKLVASTSGQ